MAEVLIIKKMKNETKLHSYQWFGTSLEVGTAVGGIKVGYERSASGSQKEDNGQVLYHIRNLWYPTCLTKFYI